MATEDPFHAGVNTGSVAHCVAMSGPLFVCAAVVKADVSVSVDCVTTVILTLGCAFS